MNCPVDNVEMSVITDAVNSYDGTSVFWLCPGIGRYPRKHVVKTEDWNNVTTFYLASWVSIKRIKDNEAP
jgi:hypothetical protein